MPINEAEAIKTAVSLLIGVAAGGAVGIFILVRFGKPVFDWIERHV